MMKFLMLEVAGPILNSAVSTQPNTEFLLFKFSNSAVAAVDTTDHRPLNVFATDLVHS